MYRNNRPVDITNKGEYHDFVEDSPSVVNREFTRVTAAALSDPQPAVHWMQLTVLEEEARWLDLSFDGYFEMPLLDNTTGGLRILEAMTSLAQEAHRVGDHALAAKISTDVSLRHALFDIDTETLSPLTKAAYRRDAEAAKGHKETTTRLLGGPCDTTVVDWNPPGETMEMPVATFVERDSPLSDATAIYRRTKETTEEGNLIYIFERTTFK